MLVSRIIIDQLTGWPSVGPSECIYFLMNRWTSLQGDVILAARDEGRGKEAVEQLAKECATVPLFHQLDIDDQESVNRLRDYLKDTYNGLDILVNNAGIAYKHASLTPFAEQAEVTLRTNYFGTLRVSEALLPLLRPGARVVNLSSMCGHLSKIPGSELKVTINALWSY